jgi:hypothetical protein
MLSFEREKYVSQLFSGYKVFDNYILMNPTAQILYGANLVYEEFMWENRFVQCLREKDCERLLIAKGMLDPNHIMVEGQFEENIDNLKVSLYENSLNPPQVKKYRDYLRTVRKNLANLRDAQSALSQYTLEYLGVLEKLRYIVRNCVRDKDKNPIVLEDHYDTEDLLIAYKTNVLGQEQCREIARNEPWMSYWRNCKEGVFGHIENYTEEQRLVCLFSRMYDSIMEDPDRPDNKILEDDDMLDGWMIFKRKERENKKITDKIEKKANKLMNADEVYIQANTQEEIDAISKMNDMNATMVKRQREEIIKKQGSAVDLDFPDRQIQLNQIFAENMKNK